MSWWNILKQPKLRLSPKTFTAFKIPPKEDKPKCRDKYMQRFEDMINVVETRIIAGAGDPNQQPEKSDWTADEFRYVVWETGIVGGYQTTSTAYSRIGLSHFVGDAPDEDFCASLAEDYKYGYNRPPEQRGSFISGHMYIEPFDWTGNRPFIPRRKAYVRLSYYWSFNEENPAGWHVEDIRLAFFHFEDMMEEILQKYGGTRV